MPALTAYEELVRLLEAQIQPGSPWSKDHNLKLERIELLVGELGHPQRRYRTIHVGGTSGKGTVAAFVAAILTAHGLRTGLHLSPYVQSLTESWQLDGRYADPSTMLDTVRRVLRAADAVGSRGAFGAPSYFEVKVAAAYQLFADERVDAAVVEVGLGGALDATNVLEGGVKVLTNVGLDHTDVLGHTVETIARDKVEIFKPGSVVVSGASQPSVREIVRAKAAEVRAPLHELERQRFAVPLPAEWPDFQVRNATLALAASQVVLGSLDDELAARALASVALPGRFELVREGSRRVVLDGAHNLEKVEATLSRLRERFPAARFVGVLALKAGKDVPAIAAVAGRFFDAVVLTRFEAGQWEAVEPSELRRAFAGSGFAGEVVVEPDPNRAFEAALGLGASDAAVVVTGSLYLVGNVRHRWHPLRDEIRHGASFAADEFPPVRRSKGQTASDETKETGMTGTTQTYELEIQASPVEVWDAITNPDRTETYGYGGRVHYDLRPGGVYRVSPTGEMAAHGAPDPILDGEVLEADAPGRLVQTWHALFNPEIAAEAPTRLTWELAEGDGGVTKLTLTHELEGAPMTAAIVGGRVPEMGGGWSFVLAELKTLLEADATPPA